MFINVLEDEPYWGILKVILAGRKKTKFNPVKMHHSCTEGSNKNFLVGASKVNDSFIIINAYRMHVTVQVPSHIITVKKNIMRPTQVPMKDQESRKLKFFEIELLWVPYCFKKCSYHRGVASHIKRLFCLFPIPRGCSVYENEYTEWITGDYS